MGPHCNDCTYNFCHRVPVNVHALGVIRSPWLYMSLLLLGPHDSTFNCCNPIPRYCVCKWRYRTPVGALQCVGINVLDSMSPEFRDCRMTSYALYSCKDFEKPFIFILS